MEKKFWKGLLVVGIVMHALAAMLMPLGLDAYVHASFTSDGMDDGESHLEWGELRTDSSQSSTPKEVPADDKWFAWHSIIEMWFSIFSPSTGTLHILGLIGGLGCLATIFLVTRSLFGQDQALQLTALASIYPPLIRATGRFYQEGIILILVTIAAYGAIKAIRDQRKISYWWLLPLFCAITILSFKGMPLWYALPAGTALYFSSKFEMNKIHIAFIALAVQLIILNRNGLSLSNPDIIPALLSAFIGYFLFVYCGMLLFTKDDNNTNSESKLFSGASKMIAASLVGWVAALWVTEAVALEAGFFDIVFSFRNNPRYLSILLIPLWYERMLRSRTKEFSLDYNNRNIVVVMISLLLIVNASVLAITGERGTEVIGSHLEGEIGVEEDILFVADSQLAIHRMYSIKFSMDPESDGENLGFWRDGDSDWHTELLECDTLKDVNWIVNYPTGNTIAPEGWIEINFEDSNTVDDDYRLYTWGGSDERCP